MSKIETAALALALPLALSVVAMARNDQVGQSQWCWQSESSTVMFCDYPSYGSCRSANRGKEQGTCVQKQ
jgi:hypothetical protein